MKIRLSIEFGSPEAARHFAVWLCESGEQQYWEWMEERERTGSGKITAVHFDYPDMGTAEKLAADPVILTKLGRLT